MLATQEIAHYAGATRRSWSSYCRKHGYDFFVGERRILANMHINWTRIEMIRRRLRSSQADWIVLVDADTFVTDDDFTLDRLVAPYAGKDVLFAPDAARRFGMWLPLDLKGFVTCRTRRPPNGGFVVVRNNAFGKYFFDRWLELARGSLRHLADRHPRTQGILWKALYRQHRDRVAVMRGEVVRYGTNRVLDWISLDTSSAFVFHDKRLTLPGSQAESPELTLVPETT